MSVFVVTVLLQHTDQEGKKFVDMRQSNYEASDKETAIGLATSQALSVKVGWGITKVLVTEVSWHGTPEIKETKA